jgi:hypothetical protein
MLSGSVGMTSARDEGRIEGEEEEAGSVCVLASGGRKKVVEPQRGDFSLTLHPTTTTPSDDVPTHEEAGLHEDFSKVVCAPILFLINLLLGCVLIQRLGMMVGRLYLRIQNNCARAKRCCVIIIIGESLRIPSPL